MSNYKTGELIVAGKAVATEQITLLDSGSIQYGSTAASAPTHTFGTAVPTAAEPDGSTYQRVGATDADATLYVRASSAWKALEAGGSSLTIPDSSALKFGTAGGDVVITADGTNAVVTGSGVMLWADTEAITVGTGGDFTIAHDGTDTLITSATGELTIDNTGATSSTIMMLGTDTAATDFQVQNDSAGALLTVDGSGQADFSGNVDATGGLDIDADSVALTIGAGGDLSISHDGTDTTATSATGNLVFDNTDATGAISMSLGTDTAATSFEVVNDSANAAFTAYGDLTCQASGVSIVDKTDQTKVASFDVSGITTGTTRDVVFPDYNVTLGDAMNNADIADPGDGNAIPVTRGGNCALTITAGADTRTLAIPTYIGQEMMLIVETDGGGTTAITVANQFNVATNTVITFDTVNEYALLKGFEQSGGLVWKLIANDGGALT